MDTSRALTLRLLLVVATASLGSCLGDQCSVVHYLAAGEVRNFSFRSGSQFMDNLHCIFSFSAPSDHHLTLAVSDLDMAPPTTGQDGKTSCVDDVLTIYDLTGGQLQAIGSYCGNNATLNREFVLSSNVAVVSFVSHESSTPRMFTLTLKAVKQMQQNQNGSTSEGQKEVETGSGEGQGNVEEGEGNGSGGGGGEGTGEEETTTETAEGEEETDGQGGEENEEGEEEQESNEGEEANGDNRKGGKAVRKISAEAPVQQKATRKPRSKQYDKQLATDKPGRKRTKQNKWQKAQAKVSTVMPHPANSRAPQEDGHRPFQLRQHTPQLFGHRKKVNMQHELQPRRRTLQLWQRSPSLRPVGKNLHRKLKHSMIHLNQKQRDTIKGKEMSYDERK